MKMVVTLLLGFMALCGLILLLLYQGFIRFNHPDFNEFPVQGIDVSHHQNTIHWRLLKGKQVRFAFIKASEGEKYQDPMFGINWKNAQAENIVPGAYHFFSLCKPGNAQAKNFVSVAGWTRQKGLPPAVDLEFGGNCGNRPSPSSLKAELTSFLQAIEKAWGCRPILYLTSEFQSAYVDSTYSRYPFWLRDIFRQPVDGKSWQFWQFANRGRLNGIDNFIDLNVFNGSSREFEAFRCTKN